MDEDAIFSLIAMEISEPKRKVKRSAGAIYAVLILLILGIISLANVLYEKWQIPRYMVQPALYLSIALYGLYWYSYRVISFRYTLTDKAFAAERISWNHETLIAVIALCEISEMEWHQNMLPYKRRTFRASVLPMKKSMLIQWVDHGVKRQISISPSDVFFDKMTAQWKSVKKAETDQI